jgi:hypothetical protein
MISLDSFFVLFLGRCLESCLECWEGGKEDGRLEKRKELPEKGDGYFPSRFRKTPTHNPLESLVSYSLESFTISIIISYRGN